MKNIFALLALKRWAIVVSPFGRALTVMFTLCLGVAASNGSEAPTNLPASAAGSTDKPPVTNVVTTANSTNSPVDKEYEDLISLDDEAQADVDKWIQDNNQAKARGKAVPDADLNRKILQRFEPVKKAYEDFVQKHPNHARARLAYGGFLNDANDEAGAQAQWEKALELDTNNPAAYNNLAGRYAESGHEEKGFGYFAKAIQLKPEEPLYYANFGDALYVFRKKAMEYYKLDEQQVFAKALGMYSNAARLDPAKFIFASSLAETYYALQPLPINDALKGWTNALKLAKTDLEQEGVYVHLARVKMLAARYEEARAQLNAVTNVAFSELKSRLLKNIGEREKEAAAAAKAPSSNIQAPEKLQAPNTNR